MLSLFQHYLECKKWERGGVYSNIQLVSSSILLSVQWRHNQRSDYAVWWQSQQSLQSAPL